MKKTHSKTLLFLVFTCLSINAEFTQEEISAKKRETLEPKQERYGVKNGGDIVFTDTVKISQSKKQKDLAIQTAGQNFIKETQQRSKNGEIETMILSYTEQSITTDKRNKERSTFTENQEVQISIPFSVQSVKRITKEKNSVYYEVVLTSSNERIANLNDKKNSVINVRNRDLRLANATYLAIIQEQQIQIVQLKEEIKEKDLIIADLRAGREPRVKEPKEPKPEKDDKPKVVRGNPGLWMIWLIDDTDGMITGQRYRQYVEMWKRDMSLR